MSKRHVQPNDAEAEATAQEGVGEGRNTQADDLAAQLQQVIAERDEARDQLFRAMADVQNIRKRTQQEIQAVRQTATEYLVRDLLPVLDNFERTIAAVESGATLESLIEGVRAVDRQLRSVLEAKNVTRIEANGADFDPNLHEAIATYTTDELPENTITGEIEAGYRMSDKVIRPAKVQVAKKP